MAIKFRSGLCSFFFGLLDDIICITLGRVYPDIREDFSDGMIDPLLLRMLFKKFLPFAKFSLEISFSFRHNAFVFGESSISTTLETLLRGSRVVFFLGKTYEF